MAHYKKWGAPTDDYLDRLALLLLFVTAALVSATLFLAYSSYLMLKQRLREGLSLLLSTIILLLYGSY